MMKKGILVFLLFLLTLATQGSWCAAERSTRKIHADHLLKPHLQVQELDAEEGSKKHEIQNPRRIGHGVSITQHTVSSVEINIPRKMGTGHRGGVGGGAGGGGGIGVGGRNMGGGAGAATRPHNSKNRAVALPVPVTSVVLALVFTCGVALSAFSF